MRKKCAWFSQKNANDAAGILGQLLVDRLIAARLIVGGGILFHSKSTNDKKTNDDTARSLAGTVFTECRLTPNLAADAELAAALEGYYSKYPIFSIGLKAFTNHHTFSLLVTNTQYMGADGMVTNTWRGKPSTWIIGFNITREL